MTIGDPYASAPPVKRRKVWPWVLGGVIVVVLACGIGGLALLGAGGKAVVNTVNEQASSRQLDVTITGCKLGEFGEGEITYKIFNHTKTAQDYMPDFDFRDKSGTTYGEAVDIVNNLAPGKTYNGKAVGSYTDGATTCVLTGA
jgi:hypothetical protein